MVVGLWDLRISTSSRKQPPHPTKSGETQPPQSVVLSSEMAKVILVQRLWLARQQGDQMSVRQAKCTVNNGLPPRSKTIASMQTSMIDHGTLKGRNYCMVIGIKISLQKRLALIERQGRDCNDIHRKNEIRPVDNILHQPIDLMHLSSLFLVHEVALPCLRFPRAPEILNSLGCEVSARANMNGRHTFTVTAVQATLVHILCSPLPAEEV